MPKSALTDTKSHKYSVSENCSRVDRLLKAHGEENFINEIVSVHFPEWNITLLGQITQEKFHLLERKLEECATTKI
jgi:hypothetical protein